MPSQERKRKPSAEETQEIIKRHGLTQACCLRCRRRYYRQRVTSTRQPITVNGHTQANTMTLCAVCVAQDQRVSQELSITPAALRELQSLQYRDITPEDYDSLSRLQSYPSNTLDADARQELIKNRRIARDVKEAEQCLICMESNVTAKSSARCRAHQQGTPFTQGACTNGSRVAPTAAPPADVH
eukprot:CAMPEP_0115866956 /NCGR_PEP_ID=MMETSP0287-20121206/20520_1 /TAXON_ID=412157 /ORGANISM="Chrysochromulina rotalis, Strain UIO044" /LENGTH=184 /DNA_ID=CAMNT_0003321547 /DNA_START=93 /DNA_END=648 /DNA_ORIENTATION=-